MQPSKVTQIGRDIEAGLDFDHLVKKHGVEHLARVLYDRCHELEEELSLAEHKLRECWKARGITP